MVDVSSQAKGLFLEAFYLERVNYSGFRSEEIRAGGKVSRANPHKEDELWWLANGPQMVQRWISWRESSDWQVWRTPDGKPAIELALTPVWAGKPVKMFIDRVFELPTGCLVVTDLKSGARSPASDLQLAWYAAGVNSVYGIPISYGAYWDARKGEMSPIYSLKRITLPLIEYWLSKFIEARNGGIFLPHLTNLCRACGVNRYCAAYGGTNADRDPDFGRSLELEGGVDGNE